MHPLFIKERLLDFRHIFPINIGIKWVVLSYLTNQSCVVHGPGKMCTSTCRSQERSRAVGGNFDSQWEEAGSEVKCDKQGEKNFTTYKCTYFQDSCCFSLCSWLVTALTCWFKSD